PRIVEKAVGGLAAGQTSCGEVEPKTRTNNRMKKQNISPLAEASTKFNYRLVDEYETKFGLQQQTSRRPFSMRELIVFLDFIKDCGADPTWHRFGLPLVYNEFN